MENGKIGAIPFYDVTQYVAAPDGSHVLMKGKLGSSEDYLAIKTEDVLYLIMGLTRAMTAARHVTRANSETISAIPAEEIDFDISTKTGIGLLQIGLASLGTLYFEIPRGASEELMKTIRKCLAPLPPSMRAADPNAPDLAALPKTNAN